MFYFGNKLKNPMINPELDKYIKKSLNNSMDKFKENYSSNNKKYNTHNSLKNIYNLPENPSTNNIYFILPFVSLFSFFVGYNFRSFLIKTIS
jgi:hypothetical protein